jgi:NAD(P)-dependent dehydrogenase (short-subunit alcohol dehydrogenase family)
MNLEGKSVVVLGASARGGSGWSTATLAHERGARVVVGARRFEGVSDLARQIDGVAVRCDASVEAEVAAMAQTAVDRHGGVDIAVLAAGVPVVGMLDELTDEAMRESIANNFLSAHYFIRQMARRMKSGGAITIMTSLAVSRPVPGYGAYACAKGAADILVRYAALEQAPRNIRVNAVAGGLIESPMSAGLRANDDIWKVFLKEVPLGRAVQPREIGAACLWLASPEAAVTGVTLDVDNGNHLLRSPQPSEISTKAYEQSAKSAGY